jgi:ribonuclease J
MAYEGMITLVMTINGQTAELKAPPQIVAQGVRGFDSTNGLTKDAEQVVRAALAGASKQTLADESLLKEHVRVELKRFIQKETGARPVIVPVIQQI